MVQITPFVAALLLSGFAAAVPTSYGSSDSSSGYSGSSSSGSSDGYSGSSSGYSGSSDSSSNGYSGSSSGYSGSSSGYSGSSDSSSNGYSGSSNNQDTSSVMDMESSTMMMDSSSTMMMDSTSTMMDSSSTMMDETSTSMYMAQATSTSYGSGSSYWGGSGYEDCVNQCVAQFGGSSGGMYQATATSGSYGSVGTGSTHTVIVAPTQGVFRFVPFATNASVGDTIEFHWGANEHTVTKSSALLPCNKSSEAPVFASGEHNESFVFTQVVNDTNPTFYYCGTPTHCEKGMFGIVNPTMASPGSPTSLGGMMSSMAANDSDLSAYSAYTSNATASNNQAATWGTNIDMSGLPTWAHALAATNVMYTRGALAMNPEILKADNSIDLSSVATTPLMLPKDLSAALDAAAAAPASTSASASTDATPAGDAATAAASSPAPSTKSNGASSVASPRFLVGAVVVLATIFAL